MALASTHFKHWGSSPFFLPLFPPSLPPFYFPALNSARGLGELSGSGRSPATKRLLVHLEVKMKRFRGHISCIFKDIT